jgi:hypothetical protein
MAAAVRAQLPRAEILGLELSQSGIEISRRKVADAEFIQCDLLKAAPSGGGQKGWATHAICSEVIEHVDDPATLLRNARPFMAENCRLVLTAPGGPMSAFDQHIGHRKHWNRADIEQLLLQAGFASEMVRGVGFPFFNLYRCLVILRGRKLITDVSSGSSNPKARAAMTVFRRLIRPSVNSSQWGWQMVAVARNLALNDGELPTAE